MSTGPLTCQVTICNQRGLHARAAAKFVKTAEVFTADIRVTKDDLTVGGTSILGLMMLAASPGSTLTLVVEGADAQAALQAVVALVEAGSARPERAACQAAAAPASCRSRRGTQTSWYQRTKRSMPVSIGVLGRKPTSRARSSTSA